MRSIHHDHTNHCLWYYLLWRRESKPQSTNGLISKTNKRTGTSLLKTLMDYIYELHILYCLQLTFEFLTPRLWNCNNIVVILLFPWPCLTFSFDKLKFFYSLWFLAATNLQRSENISFLNMWCSFTQSHCWLSRSRTRLEWYTIPRWCVALWYTQLEKLLATQCIDSNNWYWVGPENHFHSFSPLIMKTIIPKALYPTPTLDPCAVWCTCEALPHVPT